jgi:hypothetical protein
MATDTGFVRLAALILIAGFYNSGEVRDTGTQALANELIRAGVGCSRAASMLDRGWARHPPLLYSARQSSPTLVKRLAHRPLEHARPV